MILAANGFEELLTRTALLQSACTSVGVFAAGLLLLIIFRMSEKRRR